MRGEFQAIQIRGRNRENHRPFGRLDWTCASVFRDFHSGTGDGVSEDARPILDHVRKDMRNLAWCRANLPIQELPEDAHAP